MMMKRSYILFLLLGLGITVLLIIPSLAQDSQHYLLMQPISNSFTYGDFSQLKEISLKRISINFEPPFKLSGYFIIDKFIEDFSSDYSAYHVQSIEWSSRQLEEKYSVQALNISLKHKQTDKFVDYKFIFFLTKIDKEWKIYYLRGLKR